MRILGMRAGFNAALAYFVFTRLTLHNYSPLMGTNYA